MEFSRRCRQSAMELVEIAKEAPELAAQLHYLAKDWLMLAALGEKFLGFDNQIDDSETIH
jgi:hypothetical protein